MCRTADYMPAHSLSRRAILIISSYPYLVAVLQDLLALAPSKPSAAAANFSRGLAMGGDGQQLAVQLVGLLSLVCWTLVFTVPVCGVLHLAGAFDHSRKGPFRPHREPI